MNKEIIEEIYGCCTHYSATSYTLGYAMYKPFKIACCDNCGDVHLVCNKFLAFIFEHILSHFWDGSIYLSDEKIIIEEDKNA